MFKQMRLNLKFLTTIFSLTLLVSGFFVFSRVEAGDPITVSVLDIDELKTALANPEVGTINITANIEAPERLLLNHTATINGNTHTITFTGAEKNWIKDASNYVLQVYHTNATINDLKLTGGYAGLLVNDSKVTVYNIDVTGNNVGGIESSNGSAVLTISGKLTNETEEYGEPTVWEDGITADNVEGRTFIESRTVKAGQIQYYLLKSNATKTASVTTIEELKIALADTEVSAINISGNISDITERLTIDRPLIINNEGNFVLSFTDAINGLPYGSRHGILVSSDNVIINGLKIIMTARAGWQGTYGIQVYDATDVEIKDYTGIGADAALLVNGSSVKLTGTTVVGENEFGGIEVSIGEAEGLINSKLTISGSLINSSEEYAEPTVWLVNGQGEVTGAPTATNTTIKANQTQYYLLADNSIKSSIVTDQATLKSAIADSSIALIKIGNSFSVNEKILINRPVIIDGENNLLTFTGDLSGWQGNYVLHVYNTTDVIIKDIKITGGDAAILVNSSAVKITGNIDVSGNQFGGIESSKGSNLVANPMLTLVDENFTNITEAYAKPTVWEDKITDTVSGGNLTANSVINTNQVQYYIDEKHMDIVPPVVTGINHNLSSNTIEYKFNEDVQLTSQPAGVVTPVSKDLVKIYEISEEDYGPVAEASVTIDSATLSSDKKTLIVEYTGSLVKDHNAQYIIDTWGYTISDLAGNRIVLDPATQSFPVAGDLTLPTLSKLTAIVDGETIESIDGKLLVAQNSITSSIKIETSEPVTVNGDQVVKIKIGVIDYDYGTVKLDASDSSNKTLIVEPIGSNGIAGLEGVFTFTFGAGTISDIVGNDNVIQTFELSVDGTKPDLKTLSIRIGSTSNNHNKGVPAQIGVGEIIGAITAELTETATLLDGMGEITITGPLMGSSTTMTAPYGTFTVNGNQVTINPNEGNDVMAHVGTFIFRVAPGSIEDAAGNQNDEVLFTLIALDTTDPIATVIYSTTQPTNGDVTATITTNEPATLTNLDRTPIPQYVFTENGIKNIEITDAADNRTTVILTVNNIDKENPVITINPYTKTQTNQNITVTASTNEGEINSTSELFEANGSFDFIATDAAGNKSTITVTISNIDKADPIISGTPTDITVEATSTSGAIVTYIAPTTTDNYDTSISAICSPISGFAFGIGKTTVICTATDSSGNSAETTFYVTVEDTTAPVITMKGNNPITIYRGSLYEDEGATAYDIADGIVEVESTGTVNTSVVGTYTITYTAEDSDKNTATITRTVNVLRIPSNGGSRSAVEPASPAQNIEGCKPGELFNTLTGKSCTLKAIPANPNNKNEQGQVLGAEKFNFTLLLKIGSQGNEVIELQKILNTLGYDCGIADGHFGPITKAAVIKFQIANGLIGDGVVGALTRAFLNK